MDQTNKTGVEAIRCAFSDEYDDDTLARVVWSCIAEPGDGDAGVLLADLGPSEALDLVASGSRDLKPLMTYRDRFVAADILGALALGISADYGLLTPSSALWPQQVNALGATAPILLWTRGDETLLDSRMVALTGARSCTSDGRKASSEIADGLAARAWTVVAGGSYGLEAAAHQSALTTTGKTVAVLASGLNTLFPSGNSQMLENIGDTALLISERAPGTRAAAWRFQRRNRLLGAITEKSIIVEATAHSGAIATAEQALDLGRPVGIVPGGIHSATSAGCAALLREHHCAEITSAADADQL
jgi:DNA processing protein